jgi:RNA recognition motif-containing protein
MSPTTPISKLPLRTKTLSHEHLASQSNVVLLKMVSHLPPRSWLPTSRTTSARRRYVTYITSQIYSLTISQLKELFAAYEPVSAKIALRPIPRFMVKKLLARNEPRKGRGFGFVTLGSEELQQKAVAEMNDKEIEGRQIAVKVAIDSPGKEDGAEEGKIDGENGTTEEVVAA